MIGTEEYKGYDIEISYEEESENPIREWDMIGEFCCWHRKYDLGNSNRFGEGKSTVEELESYAKRTGSLLFSLYLYDHSGITISLSPFSCPWDSGQVGYVLVDREKALKEYNKKRLSKQLKDKIYQRIQGEVETYDKYLRGEIYYFNIEKDGEFIDSCHGFYEEDDAIEDAKGIVDWHKKEELKKHLEKVKIWIKNNVPLSCRISFGG